MQQKANVLIVENSGIIAKDIEEQVTELGYTVQDVTFSGKDAFEKAKEKLPDLVLTEVSLNDGMDGIELARQVDSYLNIPVVFITALSDIKTIEKANNANAYGFITKPIEKSVLMAAIEMALFRHEKAKSEKNGGSYNMYKSSGPDAGSTQQELKDEWTRATFIVRKSHLKQIKEIAYWERKKVKEVMDEILVTYLANKEINQT